MSVRQGSSIIAIGNVAVDGDTTSFNANNSLQANGVMNKNTAAGATEKIYDWVGTLAEYTAQDVATNHPDWLCFITDDQASDFVDFADINASNFTNAGMTFLSSFGMPSDRYETVTLLASGNTYTAPANGMFVLKGKANSTNTGPATTITSSNGIYCSSIRITSVMGGKIYYLTHWVKAGEVITISWDSSALALTGSELTFIYADGDKTNS